MTKLLVVSAVTEMINSGWVVHGDELGTSVISAAGVQYPKVSMTIRTQEVRPGVEVVEDKQALSQFVDAANATISVQERADMEEPVVSSTQVNRGAQMTDFYIT